MIKYNIIIEKKLRKIYAQKYFLKFVHIYELLVEVCLFGFLALGEDGS